MDPVHFPKISAQSKRIPKDDQNKVITFIKGLLTGLDKSILQKDMQLCDVIDQSVNNSGILNDAFQIMIEYEKSFHTDDKELIVKFYLKNPSNPKIGHEL